MSTKCPRCHGTGKVLAPTEARALRTERKLTLAEVSTKMKISTQYLSDLEKGKRAWNSELEENFLSSVKAL